MSIAPFEVSHFTLWYRILWYRGLSYHREFSKQYRDCTALIIENARCPAAWRERRLVPVNEAAIAARHLTNNHCPTLITYLLHQSTTRYTRVHKLPSVSSIGNETVLDYWLHPINSTKHILSKITSWVLKTLAPVLLLESQCWSISSLIQSGQI